MSDSEGEEIKMTDSEAVEKLHELQGDKWMSVCDGGKTTVYTYDEDSGLWTYREETFFELCMDEQENLRKVTVKYFEKMLGKCVGLVTRNRRAHFEKASDEDVSGVTFGDMEKSLTQETSTVAVLHAAKPQTTKKIASKTTT